MGFEECVKVISFCRSLEKRVLSSFGIEKATHGIELTEIESENFHSTCVLWVWGRNFETGITVPASTVRVARFYSKAPNPNPGLTWIRSAAQSVSACNDDEVRHEHP